MSNKDITFRSPLTKEQLENMQPGEIFADELERDVSSGSYTTGSGDLLVSPDEMLCNELNKVIEAGDKLAEAAHYVQSNYDGIHRLRLALAGWYKTRADKNGGANKKLVSHTADALDMYRD